MTWSKDWIDARKESKARFKTAIRNKRAALENEIDADDPGARFKAVEAKLAALGLSRSDVDRYLVFKGDVGPDLDKLEKLVRRDKDARRGISGLTLEAILASSRLSHSFGAFVAANGAGSYWSFISEGYKADPVTVYDRFIRRGAESELLVEADEVDELRAMDGDPGRLAADGAALLARLRQGLMYCEGAFGDDMLTKFKGSVAASAVFGSSGDSGPLRKKVLDTIGAYREVVRGRESDWLGIAPDFRKPLLDALDRIEQAINAS